jgi:RimJ/RimL family protein N-acetyltransferase
MFKTILIQVDKQNLIKYKREDVVRELDEMDKDLRRNGVEIIELECTSNIISKVVNKEDCLIISEQSSILMECYRLQIPCVGYDNPTIKKQDLYKANMVVEGFEEIDYKFLADVYDRFYNQPITVASTDRLIIREMTLEDLEELYELYRNPAITKYLEPLYEDYEEEVEFTRAYIKNMYGFYGYGLWALIHKNTGKLIGRAGLNNRELDGEIQIELGYMIGVPYQRQGYAYEACSEILKFAVDKLECYRVNCFVDKENKASLSLIRKMGFEYVQEVQFEEEMLSLYRWTDKEPKGIMNKK